MIRGLLEQRSMKRLEQGAAAVRALDLPGSTPEVRPLRQLAIRFGPVP